jgi:hypothetical protein
MIYVDATHAQHLFGTIHLVLKKYSVCRWGVEKRKK